MLPDFEMIKHSFGPEDITVIPISDVHLGAAECMEQDWLEFLRMVEQTPGIYLTLGGDLLNNATKSSVSNVYDEVYRPSDAKRMMARMLEPVKDRILCAVGGNHERRSSKDVDDDITYDIMTKLDIEDRYRANVAFVKVQMGIRKRESGTRTSSEQRPTYMLVVTHGAGGGALTGSAVNRNERFGYVLDGADALIVGHTHKPFTTQPGKIVIDTHNNQVAVRPFKVISSTSWLEFGGYAAQKMLLPTTHCLHTLTLRGQKKEIVITM